MQVNSTLLGQMTHYQLSLFTMNEQRTDNITNREDSYDNIVVTCIWMEEPSCFKYCREYNSAVYT